MIIRYLDIFSRKLSLFLYKISIYFSLPLLFFLVCLEVIMRYIFNNPLEWSNDINGLLLLITLFSALPHGWDRGYHIRMEMFYEKMSDKNKSISNLFSSISGVIFFLMLSIQSYFFSNYMFLTSETGEDINLYLWPFMLFIGICSLIFALRIIANTTGIILENNQEPWI